MANEVEYLKELLDVTVLAKKGVEYAKTVLTEAKKIIDTLRSDIEIIGSVETKSLLITEIFDVTVANIPNVMIEQLELAILVNQEFAIPILYEPLVETASKPDILKPTIIGNGWGSNILLEDNWNELAGDLSDWTAAIDSVRSSNNWSQYSERPDPDKASRFWKNVVFPSTMFESTTSERLSSAGSAAPYWYILNYGTVSMGSDWGGSPFPTNKATNFVEKATDLLEKKFRLMVNESRVVVENEIKLMMSDKKELESLVSSVELSVEKIGADFSNLPGTKEEVRKMNNTNSSLEKKSKRGQKKDWRKSYKAATSKSIGKMGGLFGSEI